MQHRNGQGGARRAPKDGLGKALTAVGWACYVLAAVLLAYVAGMLVHNDMIERSVAQDVAQAPAAWPAEQKRAMLDAARDYNAKLGERFDGQIPADARDEHGVPRESGDASYMQTLDVDGNGAMVRLRIPAISVNLPVYHSTLDDVLAKGVGHVYGTALPVGDQHTYSALAAHSGDVQGFLFSRLTELRDGDVFYLDVLGGEHGYRIEDIRTVKPDQLETTMQQLRTKYGDGNAAVTLVTCTPLGVNTDRLLVTGVRQQIPDPIPASSTQRDNRLIAVAVGIAVFLVAIIVAVVVRIVMKRHVKRYRR